MPRCFRFCSLWLRLCFYGTVQHTVHATGLLLGSERQPQSGFGPCGTHGEAGFGCESDAHAVAPDPAQLELAYREHQDPYQNLAELLRWIAENAATEKQAQLEEIIKAIGQLGYTLHLPAPALEACLHPFAGRLRRTLSQGKGEVMIVYVHPGELIETSRMMPLGFGSRVQYPLGVIVQDATGRVLSKARVLCT